MSPAAAAATGADWGTTVLMSFAAALTMFVEAIPNVVGFFVILFIGWLVAATLAKAVSTSLPIIRFSDLAPLKAGATRSLPGSNGVSGNVSIRARDPYGATARSGACGYYLNARCRPPTSRLCRASRH